MPSSTNPAPAIPIQTRRSEPPMPPASRFNLETKNPALPRRRRHQTHWQLFWCRRAHHQPHLRPADLRHHPLRSRHPSPHGVPLRHPILRLPHPPAHRRTIPQNPHLLPDLRPEAPLIRTSPSKPPPTIKKRPRIKTDHHGLKTKPYPWSSAFHPWSPLSCLTGPDQHPVSSAQTPPQPLLRRHILSL